MVSKVLLRNCIRSKASSIAIALDPAAQAANCLNFRNAKRLLPQHNVKAAHPCVLLSVCWRDEEQGHLSGREVLKIELSRPILDICGRYAHHDAAPTGRREEKSDEIVCATSVTCGASWARASSNVQRVTGTDTPTAATA